MRVRDAATFALVLCIVILFFMPPLAIVLLGLFFPFVILWMMFSSIVGLIAAILTRK